MKVFLIIIAVLAVIIIAVLSLSVTLTVVYNKGWHTKVSILFIEKDIVLSKILSFILFPENKAKEVSDDRNKKKSKKKSEKSKNNKSNSAAEADALNKSETEIPLSEAQPVLEVEAEAEANIKPDEKDADVNTGKTDGKADASSEPEQKKSNPIKNLWDKEGIVGILSFVSNLLQTANSAVTTLIKGLHIYSLYVMISVGGSDADVIARSYGTLCKYYYPLKGLILSSMKVDNYDDYIQPDFIADKTETEFQLIVSINVALLLKVALKAVAVFLKNLIANNKANKAKNG
ncbi:MAG: hypothetical protein LUG95_03460 [Clostridiales bacterium]|nr:hypothetical protein [Clostridiales bacterium]